MVGAGKFFFLKKISRNAEMRKRKKKPRCGSSQRGVKRYATLLRTVEKRNLPRTIMAELSRKRSFGGGDTGEKGERANK